MSEASLILHQFNHQRMLKRILHPDFTRKTSSNTRKAHSIILHLDQTLNQVNVLDSIHDRCYPKNLQK
jgi:hypothetical protein